MPILNFNLHLKRLLPLIIILYICGLSTPPLQAQNDSPLYDLNTIRTFNLQFESDNFFSQIDSISRNSNGYLVGDLTVDGKVYTGVGVRFRGNTSQRNVGQKRAFKIAVDHTDPDQKLMGYETLKLNNGAFDPTFMREVIYSRLTNRYFASPTANWVRLFINGQDWGLYLNVQHFNRDLLKDWFDKTKGHRYKSNSGRGTGGGAIGGPRFPNKALNWLGENPSSYQTFYELKSDPDDTDENPWEVLRDFCDVFNNTPIHELEKTAWEILDVDGALWAIALENVLCDGDGYISKGADYVIFQNYGTGRFHILQHDGNESFRNPTVWSLFQGWSDPALPIINRLLSVPSFRLRYIAHVRTVINESLRWDALGEDLTEIHSRIAPIVESDPKKIFSFGLFQSNLESNVSIGGGPGGGTVPGLRTFINQRKSRLMAFAELQADPGSIDQISLTALDDQGNDIPEALPGFPVRIQVEARFLNSNNPPELYVYHTDTPDGVFSVFQLSDEGDTAGTLGDGIYSGQIPGYPAGSKVHYYVESRTSEATVFSPTKTEKGALTYKVGITEAEFTPIVINELMASNDSTIEDPQGDFDDWVELLNISDSTVDLGGMYLSDKEGNPRKWRIPDGVTMAPGEYLVVWLDEDGGDNTHDDGDLQLDNLHANFKLTSSGESVFLVNKDEDLNQILDQVTFEKLETDTSWGRLPDGEGDFAFQDPPSPSFENGTTRTFGFIRGDADNSGVVDISDSIYILSYLFIGDLTLVCEDAADTDDLGEVDITDPIFLLMAQFLGSRTIPAPGFECGVDLTEDDLECEEQVCEE